MQIQEELFFPKTNLAHALKESRSDDRISYIS
jgi:hypothetical protein